MTLRALVILAALSGALRGEVAQALSPSAEAAPQALTESADGALGHSGFLMAFGFSRWSLFNSAPLAYTPFELGYDFGNGLRIQSGMDIFFYEGTDLVLDQKNVPIGVDQYSYEMTNWRTSLLYQVPFPIRLRPLVGISANVVGGSRKLARFQDATGKDINADKPKIPAWGYTGLGIQAGLEYLLNSDWTLSFTARYDTTFSTVPSPLVQQLGLAVTF